MEAENKLSRIIGKREIREDSELWGEKVGIVEVKKMMLATKMLQLQMK